MSVIFSSKGIYHRIGYENEADLERSILVVQKELFGVRRIYLPIKKKIGLKGGPQSIPDGYLIDLASKNPRLYVVENELATHDLLRHIAVQILQFSLSFEAEGRGVRSILFNALNEQPEYRKKCEAYAASRQFRNLDHLLDYLVFETPFAALIVIDEMPDGLENALVKKFQFGVEVIELAKYQAKDESLLYRFEPFLEDLGEDISADTSPDEIDTLVVPGREDGVQEVFLGENRWYAIRIHGTMRPQIKHIALYQVAPISAITHLAPVKSIEPWKDSGKFVVNFASPAEEIKRIPLIKGGRVKPLQSIRYTTKDRLEKATNLDEIW